MNVAQSIAAAAAVAEGGLTPQQARDLLQQVEDSGALPAWALRLARKRLGALPSGILGRVDRGA